MYHSDIAGVESIRVAPAGLEYVLLQELVYFSKMEWN